MLWAATRVNFEHFFQDLAEGDPVVWAITLGMIGFTAFGLYRKYCQFSTAPRESD